MHQALLGARKTWLRDALNDALADLNPADVKAEIAKLVPEDAQRILAAGGIRDEHVFPTRIVLERSPTLLAYYRLVLGLSRKNFYERSTGHGLFASMENTGRITPRQAERLDELIAVMIDALADVVRQLSPAVTTRDVDELPLLTLGSQLQGARNVEIGKQGTQDVFLSIRSIVEPHIDSETATEIVVTNAAGRKVYTTLAADPDVRIREDVGGGLSYKAAIEIKAGTDARAKRRCAGADGDAQSDALLSGKGRYVAARRRSAGTSLTHGPGMGGTPRHASAGLRVTCSAAELPARLSHRTTCRTDVATERPGAAYVPTAQPAW